VKNYYSVSKKKKIPESVLKVSR